MAKKPTLRVNHDYISINFGNGRVFTCNRNGEKATNLPIEVFDTLCKYIKEAPGPYGKRFEMLLREIDYVWPEWNEKPPEFVAGDRLLVGTGKKPKLATYIEKRKTNIAVRIDGEPGVVLCSPHLVKKA